MKTEVIIALGIYMVAMLLIGFWAYRKTSTLSGYMLGDRGLGPAVTALSAGASDMSGWLVMGLPGAMYATGISNLWLPIGLTIGAYFNYRLLAPRLRTYTEVANDSITIPDFLENRFNDKTNILRLVSGLVIFVFFIFYTSSGMVSGGTLFQSAFGLNYKVGLLVTAVVVLLYTLFGGFLAVSMTDFVQGTIMFIALILVPVIAFTKVGGVHPVVHDLRTIDPSLLNLFKGTSVLGIIGLLAWGLGYFGQPHIIVRFMAIKSVKELKAARRIGIGWMILTLLGASAVGLVGISYFAHHGGTLKNPETVFVQFANLLFNPIITGFILAAMLAAIMSTISSQLLVTASALTEDFYKTFIHRKDSDKVLVLVGRLAVLLVAVIAFLMSLNPNNTILNLVSHAWAGFGSAFGPIILLSLFWKRMSKWGALAGMVVGGLTVIIWVSTGLSNTLYEMVPGFILSWVASWVVSLLNQEPAKEIQDQFKEMEEKLHA
ncbi:sodium/proline symporter PutP [Pullulanibacillus sp. KACC 23026]|uniref:sodium/proline symporter PutP n=1 Tax=Pullulanibacillus sp. KACC 23026 TaxID=3028315 RepID=UPI0023B179D9|nr:sodium/proline symporter PutP [Pullulanibacillus sp. KACC 23026]WEG12958.1 sodium/proline symporter PutP [Pullulanibacillus sp. KACC 23026]